MSKQAISFLEKFFQRHENNPNLYRIIYSLAGFCLLVGFLIFNVAGYHRATALGGHYAELGLFVLALLFLFSGAMILTIKKRLRDSDFRSPAHVIVFHFKIVAIPLGLAVLFSLDFARFFWIVDSYMELTVKANEQVKKDLKWLLGDLYPEDQEKNIDPETLEWRMVLDEVPGINYQHVIRDSSHKADTRYIESYKNKQLNVQRYEAIWQDNGEKKTEHLNLEWSKAEFFGYNQSERKNSYPVCDVRVPINSKEFQTDQRYIVLINGEIPEEHLVDHKGFGFRQAGPLPALMRIDGNELVIRTNFIGSTWPVYCLLNFPKEDRNYTPEPMTSASLASLNSSFYRIHFALFPGLHLKSPIIDYQIHRFVRRSSYDEFFDSLDLYVVHRISVSRSGIILERTY